MRKFQKISIAIVGLILISVLVLFLCSTKLLKKAVDDCNPELAKFSILLGGDVNAQYDHMPLLMSAWPETGEKCPDVFNILIDAGADVNAKILFENTPLFYALLINHDLELAKLLINAGADVNVKYSKYSIVHFEEAPLILSVSCYYNNELVNDAVKLLIDAGANVNVAGYESFPDNRIKLLADDVEPKGIYNPVTPLMCAVRSDNAQLVRMLIDGGSDVKFADDEGNTVLHRYVNHRTLRGSGHHGTNNDIVKALIDAGVNINAQNKFGVSALHDAVYYSFDDTEIVKTLINAGADINMVDNDGETALHIAARQHHYEIVKYLIDAGADVSITNKKGETALDVSKNHSIQEVLKRALADKAQETISNEAPDDGGEVVKTSN